MPWPNREGVFRPKGAGKGAYAESVPKGGNLLGSEREPTGQKQQNEFTSLPEAPVFLSMENAHHLRTIRNEKCQNGRELRTKNENRRENENCHNGQSKKRKSRNGEKNCR